MAVDFTEKAKRYQAIDEIIASGRMLKWNEIISEMENKYNLKTSRTSFFRDIEELVEKYGAPIDTDMANNGYFYHTISDIRHTKLKSSPVIWQNYELRLFQQDH